MPIALAIWVSMVAMGSAQAPVITATIPVVNGTLNTPFVLASDTLVVDNTYIYTFAADSLQGLRASVCTVADCSGSLTTATIQGAPTSSPVSAPTSAPTSPATTLIHPVAAYEATLGGVQKAVVVEGTPWTPMAAGEAQLHVHVMDAGAVTVNSSHVLQINDTGSYQLNGDIQIDITHVSGRPIIFFSAREAGDLDSVAICYIWCVEMDCSGTANSLVKVRYTDTSERIHPRGYAGRVITGQNYPNDTRITVYYRFGDGLFVGSNDDTGGAWLEQMFITSIDTTAPAAYDARMGAEIGGVKYFMQGHCVSIDVPTTTTTTSTSAPVSFSCQVNICPDEEWCTEDTLGAVQTSWDIGQLSGTTQHTLGLRLGMTSTGIPYLLFASQESPQTNSSTNIYFAICTTDECTASNTTLVYEGDSLYGSQLSSLYPISNPYIRGSYPSSLAVTDTTGLLVPITTSTTVYVDPSSSLESTTRDVYLHIASIADTPTPAPTTASPTTAAPTSPPTSPPSPSPTTTTTAAPPTTTTTPAPSVALAPDYEPTLAGPLAAAVSGALLLTMAAGAYYIARLMARHPVERHRSSHHSRHRRNHNRHSRGAAGAGRGWETVGIDLEVPLE